MMEALVALVLASVFGQTLSFECPRSNVRGLFADPEDCSKYYQCVNGGRYYPKNCPPGLWFDSRYSICNWPGYVSCNTRRPEIQPLASEETDPVLSGTIRRYPQKLGRQIHTTKKRSSVRTKPPSTRPIVKETTTTAAKTTTTPTTVKPTPESTTVKKTEVPEIKTTTSPVPQTERTTEVFITQGTSTDPSPGPIFTTMSAIDWLYQDNVLYDHEEPKVENIHPEAPPKSNSQLNPVNSVAALDEYGSYEDQIEYQDTGFDPPPECSAAFSLELDPTRCEGFYQCYLWIPYPKVCPAGLLFDHDSNVCNWPEYVYCLNGERYDPPETTTTENVVTKRPTPPAPSNNFNPLENGGLFPDNNYDDYWPIEGVMEGEHHQTAFKNKGLHVDSSQFSEETENKRSTPKIRVTTLMMKTDSMMAMDECGSDGCNSANSVQTSDYKLQPKMSAKASLKTSIKSSGTKTKGEDSTVPTTAHSPGTIKLANVKENGSTSSSESHQSSSQSDSDDSNLSSSEEIQNGMESLHSSEESNKIVKPELRSNSVKIKENEIEVEIVEVKSNNGENKIEMEESGTKNISQTKKTETTPMSTSPTVDLSESSEESSSNATSSEDFEGGQSSESLEGSGSVPVLSKIDTLRNSVEKLISDEKTNASTTEKVDSFSNATTDSKPTPVTEVPEMVSTVNTTENATGTTDEKTSIAPKNITDSLFEPPSTNITENTTASEISEELDSNTTSVKASVPAGGKVEKVSDDTKQNISTVYPSSSTNQTENSTVDDTVTENNVTIADDLPTDTNVTISNQTTVGLNISSETTEPKSNSTSENPPATILHHTSGDSDVSSTTSTTSTTTATTTTTTAKTTTTTIEPKSSSIPSTTRCSGRKCHRASRKPTTKKAKSAAQISRASGHFARKPKARRADIVMLSGKSPIARILEKLLNIRMKQIGNNKFKAIEATKQALKESEVPSENKIKSSPKSQNDEARTPSTTTSTTTSTRTVAKKTSPFSPEVTRKLTSKSSVTSTTTTTTKASTVTEGLSNTDDTELTTNVTNNNITLESAINMEGNESTSVVNTTDLGNLTNAISTLKPSTESETNVTEVPAEVKTTEVLNSSNTTTTAKTTTVSTLDTTKSTDGKKVSAALAQKTQKDTKQPITKTTAATKITTKTAVTTPTDKTTTTESLSTGTSTTENSTVNSNVTLPVSNANETNNSSVQVDDTYSAKMDLNTTVLLLNATDTSNTSNSTNESTRTTVNPTTETAEKTDVINKTTSETTNGENATRSISLENDNSTVENTTLIEIALNITSSLDSSKSTPGITTTTTSIAKSTTIVKKTSTEMKGAKKETKTSTTTAMKTSKKQKRETNKPARRPTHFRQKANAPHFEARKVFGGPDEKWRFSDGSLVDQFSRQQRDVDTMNELSSAYQLTPSLLLITVVLYFINQLA